MQSVLKYVLQASIIINKKQIKREDFCQSTILCRRLEEGKSLVPFVLKQVVYNNTGRSSQGNLERKKCGQKKCHCKYIFLLLSPFFFPPPLEFQT